MKSITGKCLSFFAIATILFMSCQKSANTPDPDDPIDSSNTPPKDTSTNQNEDSSSGKRKYVSVISDDDQPLFYLIYDNKNRLTTLNGWNNEPDFECHYDENGHLTSTTDADSVFYNNKGQIIKTMSGAGFGHYFVDTYSYNSMGKAETIVSEFSGDSVHLEYNSDSDLVHLETWGIDGTTFKRVLDNSVDYLKYDTCYNPFHGLVPEGMIIYSLQKFAQDRADYYLQFNKHNVVQMINHNTFETHNFYYKYDTDKNVTVISDNSMFVFPKYFFKYY